MDVYKITWQFEGETFSELVEEWKLERWIAKNSDVFIISIEPSEGTKRQIQAEIEAYKRGEMNAFKDEYRERRT